MRAAAMVCNSEGSAYVWPTLHMRGGSLPSTRPKIHSPGKVCSQAAVLLVSGVVTGSQDLSMELQWS